MPRFCSQFVDSNFELGSNYSDVIAPQDVATYGGLCALASFDRAELKVKSNSTLLLYFCCRTTFEIIFVQFYNFGPDELII